jgi:hypothetical protein
MIAKKKLNEWLIGFIRVMCELSGPSFLIDVNTNRGVLRVPSDIFDILKHRRVIEPWRQSFILTFPTGDMGDAVVRVIADPQLKTGLILTIDNVKK